jgi:hypothetical protein
VKHFALAVLVLFSFTRAEASDHIAPGHPMAGEPHWYDRDCCDMRDCEPLPSGGTVEDVPGKGLRVRYTSAINGLEINGIIPYSRIRPSRDGNIHPCQIPPMQSIRCLYMPFGA